MGNALMTGVASKACGGIHPKTRRPHDAIAATLIEKNKGRRKTDRRDRGLVALAALDAHGDFFRAGPVLEEVDDAHVAYV